VTLCSAPSGLHLQFGFTLEQVYSPSASRYTSGFPVTLHRVKVALQRASNALLASASAGTSSSAEIKILMRFPLLDESGSRCATLCEPITIGPRAGLHQQPRRG